jgi:hypothetical protein
MLSALGASKPMGQNRIGKIKKGHLCLGEGNLYFNNIYSYSLIVHFFDIGGIDNHHCSNFLFIISIIDIHLRRESSGPGCGQAQKCGGVKQITEITTHAS